jgi:hypothetical protein
MIYTIEGTPKTQTLELPTGEEIQLKLPDGGTANSLFSRLTGLEGEEEFVSDEKLLVIDDSLLAKLTLRLGTSSKTNFFRDNSEKEKTGDGKSEEKEKEKEDPKKATLSSPSKSGNSQMCVT